MADCCLVPQVYNAANRFKVDMKQFPNINRIVQNLEQVKAFVRAHPDNQPDKQWIILRELLGIYLEEH